MSYDIKLLDPLTNEVAELPEDAPQGGTYVHGGTREAWFNVTYNYYPQFCRVLGKNGIRAIYGKTGAESEPLLLDAIEKLGDDEDQNYWKPTEGNAKKALNGLLFMACALPHCIWDGD